MWLIRHIIISIWRIQIPKKTALRTLVLSTEKIITTSVTSLSTPQKIMSGSTEITRRPIEDSDQIHTFSKMIWINELTPIAKMYTHIFLFSHRIYSKVDPVFQWPHKNWTCHPSIIGVPYIKLLAHKNKKSCILFSLIQDSPFYYISQIPVYVTHQAHYYLFPHS